MPSRKSNPTTASPVAGDDADDAMVSTPPQTATEQQLKARSEGVSVEDYLLPRALTQRLAKSVLPPNTTIQKDALLAIQKAATVFISYLSSHANEATLKRTVAPTDVLAALQELEFDAFLPRLELELAAHADAVTKKRDANREKKAAAAAAASMTKDGMNEDEEVVNSVSESSGVKVTARGSTKRLKRDPHSTQDRSGIYDEDETEEEVDETDEVDDGKDLRDDDEETEEGTEEEQTEEQTEEEEEDDISRVEDLDADQQNGGRRRGGWNHGHSSGASDESESESEPDSENVYEYSNDYGDDNDVDEDDDGPGAQLRENMRLG